MAVWSAIALGAIGLGVVVAFVAGYLLGHFTGHEKTTTISAVSSTTAGEAGAEGEEAKEAQPKEAQPESAAGAPASQGSSKSKSKLEVEADPSGELKFTKQQLSAKAGKVEVDFDNKSPVPHDVAIEGNGEVIGETNVIAEGADSTVLNLKPGTYTYFCTVPGHREAGMEGKLVVK